MCGLTWTYSNGWISPRVWNMAHGELVIVPGRGRFLSGVKIAGRACRLTERIEPRRVTDRLGEEVVRGLLRARERGATFVELAKRFGVSVSSVRRLLVSAPRYGDRLVPQNLTSRSDDCGTQPNDHTFNPYGHIGVVSSCEPRVTTREQTRCFRRRAL